MTHNEKFHASVKALGQIVSAYRDQIRQGRKVDEALNFCESIISDLEKALRGESHQGMSMMLDFMTGIREVPAEGTWREPYILAELKLLEGLREEAEEKWRDAPCEHKYRVISSYWSTPLWSARSIDVRCDLCDTVKTIRSILDQIGILMKNKFLDMDLVNLFNLPREELEAKDEFYDRAAEQMKIYFEENNIPEERSFRDLIHDLGLTEKL